MHGPRLARPAAPRILLIRPGAIGDTLLTYPALLALRARRPTAAVHVVGNAVAARLLAGGRTGGGRALLDGLTAFDAGSVTGLFQPSGPTDAARAAFGRIDTAVAWCADPDGVLKANLRRLGATTVVVAPSRPSPSDGVHVAAHLVSTLAALGIAPDAAPELLLDRAPILAASHAGSGAADAELARLGLAGRPFVAVHPGSGSASKNWPAERFARILDRVTGALGLDGVVLAGPAEEGALARVCAALARPVPVVRDVPLAQVAGIIGRSRAYLGNDSGLTHLAGLLGVPTLALFGPTDPALWAPLGPWVRVLRHQPLDGLAVDDVHAALSRLLADVADGGRSDRANRCVPRGTMDPR